jgi:signal recognition particle GTPase
MKKKTPQKKKSKRMKNLKQNEAEDATVEEEEATQAPEDQEEESGEELLQGEEQPKVRRSTKTVARRTVMNIAKNSAKTYDAQLSQAVEGEIEYDLQEAKMFAMVILHIREKIKTRRQKIEVQHIITYSLNKGLKKFGPREEEAAVKEMQQMIDWDCYQSIGQN